MKRILMLLVVVALMVVMMAMSVAPVFANHLEASQNKEHASQDPVPEIPFAPHCRA